MNKDFKIVFMGTPDFAVASLDILVQNGFNIVGVVTAPDKPAGRGLQLQESAVKRYAVSKGLKVLQPEKLKNPAFLEELKALNADLQVVVAFRMLPELVWNMPPQGTINVHASLLPNYRGAAPINWAVINGEKESGVTTFKLQHEIDTGDVLFSERVPIREDETAGELHDVLMQTGATLLLKTVTAIAENQVTPIPQANIPLDEIKHAPKIFKETCQIKWDRPLDAIYNLVRGLSPYPTAWTTFQGKTLKIFKAHKEHTTPTVAPGEFVTDQKTFIKIAAPDGYLSLDEIQLEGKKKMDITSFLRGYRF
ncbi:methionyl-tRNA formyltransferase [Chitinophaga terrae (ex Kim and Jung 2007)]|uniref:Methionyl-tRNA formyltransferase n=1 Tax=Chitinophaga terrae (ex Kim and Jung 2007) TaxID=408074 RepID=A0A1H4C0L4_9BACT|nr:methionyl-tRNA formyltransferase [Chitinophaga terrae (ex Kim and Jung 2007)]GEP91944.1 methionyl-tRNA formyltransferase [Chitinophaga terrae (ex Kim and Jung 2007)]SEA53622.1 methionyl-tRNA formyltransferase [Chitinophaga terrae (ex Kim and Jung 2007)]